jgi:hypothetical protein
MNMWLKIAARVTVALLWARGRSTRTPASDPRETIRPGTMRRLS